MIAKYAMLIAVLASLLALAMVSCGGSGGGGAATPTFAEYRGSQAPGDVWTYTLGATSFTASNLTLGYDYAGSVIELGNGFLKLTVTSSDDPDLSGQLPMAAYAVEVPGVALAVKPADPDGNVVVCVAVDETPDAETTYNYVKYPDPDWLTASGALDDEEVWGRATSSISGGGSTFDFLIEYWTMSNTTTSPSRTETAGETFTALDGWLVPDAGDQRVGITPEGMIVQDYGPDSGGAMGLEAPSGPFGDDTLFQSDHDFLGFVLHYAATSENTEAIWAEAYSGGDYLSVGAFDAGTGDFDDAVPTPELVRLTLGTEMSDGVFRGTLIEPGPDSTLGTADDVKRALVILCGEVASRYFLFGLIEPTDAGDPATNFLLIEQ